MTTTINQINAGIIVTETQMLRGDRSDAISRAQTCRLLADLDQEPHRATVVRLVGRMWDKQTREREAATQQHTRQAEADACVADAFPAEWAAAQAKTGRARREARRLLRRRYASCHTDAD